MRGLLAIGLVSICIGLSGCGAAPPVAVGNKPVSVNGQPMKDAPSRPLKPIGEMNWTNFDGGTVQKLKDYSGKVVILDFWATYCPPCIEEIPHLMELKARYGDDLVLIGLHVGGEEDRPKVPEFVEKLKINYPLATAEDALTSLIFGQESAIPQTAIFDRSGKLVKKIVGFSPEIKKELDTVVEQTVDPKMKDQLNKTPMETVHQHSAGGVAVRAADSEPEIVIIRTSEEGRWQLPKGIIDPGETAEQAAVREVREEAGIDCEIAELIETIEYWFVASYHGPRKRYHKKVTFFLMNYLSGNVADHDHEVTEARWVGFDEALAMLDFQNEKDVVERAREMARS